MRRACTEKSTHVPLCGEKRDDVNGLFDNAYDYIAANYRSTPPSRQRKRATMPKRSEPGKLPTVPLEEWFRRNELTTHTRFDRACFHRMAGLPVIGDPYSTYGCQGEGCGISGANFDHPRRFRVKGPNRISSYAGVISAPYLYDHEMLQDAQLITEQFGLQYRIGDPRDDWYGHGTTSLVIWNSDKISL